MTPACEKTECLHCGAPVWMCEHGECPLEIEPGVGPHSNGCETNGGWVCSPECWERVSNSVDYTMTHEIVKANAASKEPEPMKFCVQRGTVSVVGIEVRVSNDAMVAYISVQEKYILSQSTGSDIMISPYERTRRNGERLSERELEEATPTIVIFPEGWRLECSGHGRYAIEVIGVRDEKIDRSVEVQIQAFDH